MKSLQPNSPDRQRFIDVWKWMEIHVQVLLWLGYVDCCRFYLRILQLNQFNDKNANITIEIVCINALKVFFESLFYTLITS